MTRHPAVVASMATAIQQLSGDRFAYGISTGDSALRNIGVRPARLAELEEYLRCVQAMTNGAPATYRGEAQQLRLDHRPTPVWMAAEGPRTLELAAGSPTASCCRTRSHPARSSATSDTSAAVPTSVGRNVDDLDVWCMANVVPADD